MKARPREHYRNDTITSSGAYRSPTIVNAGVPKHDANYFLKFNKDFEAKQNAKVLQESSLKKNYKSAFDEFADSYWEGLKKYGGNPTLAMLQAIGSDPFEEGKKPINKKK